MRSLLVGAVFAGLAGGVAAHEAEHGGPANVYPTVAVADYVLACMAANGGTREALRRCACSIDVIATILPYAGYETAEAFLSLRQVAGERGTIFRDNEQANEAVGLLRRAQIEAELRCF